MLSGFDPKKPAFSIFSIAALTAVFLYLSLFIFPAIPRLIEGDAFINFEDARRMIAGQTLYGDIFQYTLPGTELLELPVIKIFGAKVAVLNILALLVGVAEMMIAVMMASSILGGWDVILASLFFLCFGYHCGLSATHHVFSVALAFAAMAVLLRKRDPVHLIAAGTLIGFATCFTQTRGLVALAIGAFLFWEDKSGPGRERNLLRDQLCLFLPFAIIVGLACGYVVWNGGWVNFYRDIVKFPLLYYPQGYANNWATAFSDWFPTVRGVVQWTLIKLLVPGPLVAFWLYCWEAKRRGDQPPVEAIFLAVCGSALLATIFYAPLHVRLAEISLPSIILAVWMLRRFGWTVWTIPAWSVVAAFLILAPLNTQLPKYWYYDSRAGEIAVSDPNLVDELTWLGLHTQPGDSFFDPSQSMLYVLLDLRNPARVPFVEPDGYTRPHQAIWTASRLHRAQPHFILWPFSDGDADDPSDHLYLLGEELRANYHPVMFLRDGEVWERKNDARSN